MNFGLASTQQSVGLEELQLNWYDRWLKGPGDGVDSELPVKIFVMGINQWGTSRSGPRPSRRHSLVPRRRRHPQTDTANQQGPERYVYAPADPVLTHGDNLVMAAVYRPGQFDQAVAESRAT